MRAMFLDGDGVNADGRPALRFGDAPLPEPGAYDLRVRVSVCGVCRTDLDLAEGRLIAPRYPVIPGHQIVGRVEAVGKDSRGFSVGQRVGVAWINSACGTCHWCVGGSEKLCAYCLSRRVHNH